MTYSFETFGWSLTIVKGSKSDFCGSYDDSVGKLPRITKQTHDNENGIVFLLNQAISSN